MTERSVVVLSGGVSQPSSTRLLADRLTEAVTAALAERGEDASTTVVELRDLAHATVDATMTGFASGPLRAALDALAAADAVILVSPVYTASLSGMVKSFLDVVEPDALDETPTLIGATGGTARHSLALEYAVRPVLAALRADVVPTAVFAATDDWADGGGDDVRPLTERIADAAAELASAVTVRDRKRPVSPYETVPSFTDLLDG